MQKLPEQLIAAATSQAQTDSPLKSKGRVEKKNSFFWESYTKPVGGKKSTMNKWDKEFRQAAMFKLSFDKNGNIESKTPIQQIKTAPTFVHKNKKDTK